MDSSRGTGRGRVGWGGWGIARHVADGILGLRANLRFEEDDMYMHGVGLNGGARHGMVAATVSLRRLVAKAADALLDERQVRVERIKGDGRCMFRAIARNLAAFDGRKLSEGAERQDADFLRHAAYNVVCVEKKKEFQASYLIEGSIDRYCSQMRSPSFYGGETEMFILADLLQKPIAVYLPAGRGKFQKIICYGEKYLTKTKSSKGGGPETIKLLYNGVNHYEALIDRC